MAVLLPNGKQSFANNAGQPLNGGKLYTYDAGTNNPRATWADANKVAANTNPVILDARGEATVFWDGAYKVTLKDALDNIIWTIDNIVDVLSQLSGPTGTSLIYYKEGDANSILRTLLSRLQDRVSVRDFGAVGDGVTDDTAAFNSALATGKKITVPGLGRTYICSGILNMAADGSELEIEGGATVSLTTAFQIGFNVTGRRCRISGRGRIVSPAQWNGANARSTYGTVWVTGDDFSYSGVTLDGVPRVGIMFEECTNGRVEDCAIIGNYPYANYIDGTTTGHAGIEYNPPTTGGTTTSNGNGSLVVDGVRVKTCIQGFLLGNYGGTANEVGITITGSSFGLCWNHGNYLESSKGALISGNNYTNCQYPIVSDGKGTTVSGCTLYNDELVQINGWCGIQLRQAQDCIIEDCTLTGVGASIVCDVIDSALSTAVMRNRISNIVIRRTGPNLANNPFAIRLGSAALTCERNTIENITISAAVSGTFGPAAGVIQLEMAAGSRGAHNTVRNVKVQYDEVITGTQQIVYARAHDYLVLEDNEFVSTATAAAAQVLQFYLLDDCQHPVVRRNKSYQTAGGANVTVRGVQMSTTFIGGEVYDNGFLFNAAGLAGAFTIDFIGPNADARNNHLDMSAKMGGSIIWLNGTASFDIPNKNALAAFSRAYITPTNINAGTNIKNKGVLVAITDGHVTLSTADATNIAGNSTFNYDII